MPKGISEEAKCVAAASLVQAHAAILGGVYAGRKPGAPVHAKPHELVERLYSHFLGVIESGGKTDAPLTGLSID